VEPVKEGKIAYTVLEWSVLRLMLWERLVVSGSFKLWLTVLTWRLEVSSARVCRC